MAKGIKKSSELQAQSGDIVTLESAFTHDNLWEIGSGSVGETKMIEFYDGTASVFEATQEEGHSQTWDSSEGASVVYKITLDRAISEGDVSKKEIYAGGDCEVLRNKREWIPVKLLAKDDLVFDSNMISNGRRIGEISVDSVEKIEDNTDILYSAKSWNSNLTTLFVGGILMKV